MKPHASSALRLFGLIAITLLVARAQCADLVDDRAVSIHSARDVKEKRRALVQYLWGAEGFPERRMPDLVLTNVASPVQHLDLLARVDEFRFELAPGLQGLAYHFIPARPNRELVVVHLGKCPAEQRAIVNDALRQVVAAAA